uniref:Uncharacterized protein n=1 Tax=Amphimedon queenslandica TaxID=400682 RepID=A0A1X7UZH4_AMPQE
MVTGGISLRETVSMVRGSGVWMKVLLVVMEVSGRHVERGRVSFGWLMMK